MGGRSGSPKLHMYSSLSARNSCCSPRMLPGRMTRIKPITCNHSGMSKSRHARSRVKCAPKKSRHKRARGSISRQKYCMAHDGGRSEGAEIGCCRGDRNIGRPPYTLLCNGRVTATLAQLLDACAPSAKTHNGVLEARRSSETSPKLHHSAYHLPRTQTSAPVKRYFLINQQQISVP